METLGELMGGTFLDTEFYCPCGCKATPQVVMTSYYGLPSYMIHCLFCDRTSGMWSSVEKCIKAWEKEDEDD